MRGNRLQAGSYLGFLSIRTARGCRRWRHYERGIAVHGGVFGGMNGCDCGWHRERRRELHPLATTATTATTACPLITAAVFAAFRGTDML